MSPLVQAEGHSFLCGSDVGVDRAEWLVEFSHVDSLIARRNTNVVGSANVGSVLHGFAAFHHRFRLLVDVVNDLTKCNPSVTRKQTGEFR